MKRGHAARTADNTAVPTQNAAEIPAPIAMTTASTDAQTDVAPLTPQSQGAIDGERCSARRIPSGNAIPMQKPTGSRMPTAISDAHRRGRAFEAVRDRRRGDAEDDEHRQRDQQPSSRRAAALRRLQRAPVERLPDAARQQQREQHDRQAVGRMAEEDRQPLQLRDLDQHEAEADRREVDEVRRRAAEGSRCAGSRTSGSRMHAAVSSVTVTSSTPSTPTAFMLNETMP